MTQRYQTLTPDDIINIRWSSYSEEVLPWCKSERYDPKVDEYVCPDLGIRCDDCMRRWLEEEVEA